MLARQRQGPGDEVGREDAHLRLNRGGRRSAVVSIGGGAGRLPKCRKNCFVPPPGMWIKGEEPIPGILLAVCYNREQMKYRPVIAGTGLLHVGCFLVFHSQAPLFFVIISPLFIVIFGWKMDSRAIGEDHSPDERGVVSYHIRAMTQVQKIGGDPVDPEVAEDLVGKVSAHISAQRLSKPGPVLSFFPRPKTPFCILDWSCSSHPLFISIWKVLVTRCSTRASRLRRL